MGDSAGIGGVLALSLLSGIIMSAITGCYWFWPFLLAGLGMGCYAASRIK